MTTTPGGVARWAAAPGGTGVFGGTFDPPHVAHITAAVWARSALGLQRVLLVVAGDPWQKSAVGAVTPGGDRLAMVQLACEGVEGIEACDLEVRRQGPSYTAETLEELAGDAERLVLILGADAVSLLPTWHRHADLPSLAELAVIDRAGLPVGGAVDPVALGFVTHRVQMPRLDVASTDLRARLRSNQPVDGLVAPTVLDYIRSRGLYGDVP